MLKVGEAVFCRFSNCDHVRSFGPGVGGVEESFAIATFPKNKEAVASVAIAMCLIFMILLLLDSHGLPGLAKFQMRILQGCRILILV